MLAYSPKPDNAGMGAATLSERYSRHQGPTRHLAAPARATARGLVGYHGPTGLTTVDGCRTTRTPPRAKREAHYRGYLSWSDTVFFFRGTLYRNDGPSQLVAISTSRGCVGTTVIDNAFQYYAFSAAANPPSPPFALGAEPSTWAYFQPSLIQSLKSKGGKVCVRSRERGNRKPRPMLNQLAESEGSQQSRGSIRLRWQLPSRRRVFQCTAQESSITRLAHVETVQCQVFLLTYASELFTPLVWPEG